MTVPNQRSTGQDSQQTGFTARIEPDRDYEVVYEHDETGIETTVTEFVMQHRRDGSGQ
jgi:hypothetical protein